MSVFDQFLYPRHCCAERPRGPDGSCCRSLPALPCPPPNSLQIPGMPAHTPPPTTPPRKPAPGRAEAGISLRSRGRGPSLASPPHRRQLTQGRSPVVSGGSRLSSPLRGRQQAVHTRNKRSTGSLLVRPQQGWVLCFWRDAQTPKSPLSQPQRHSHSTRAAGDGQDDGP